LIIELVTFDTYTNLIIYTFFDPASHTFVPIVIFV